MSGPRVLVTYGSRHGSTAEIAAAIAGVLRDGKLATDLAPASDVADVASYDVVVVGSAVYLLRWHPDVVAFLGAHERALAARVVWLFESGPLDDRPETRRRDLPPRVAAIADRTGIRGRVTFGGRLRPSAEGVLEQLMTAGGLARDYREWDLIRAWSRQIADDDPANVLRLLAPTRRTRPTGDDRRLPAERIRGTTVPTAAIRRPLLQTT